MSAQGSGCRFLVWLTLGALASITCGGQQRRISVVASVARRGVTIESAHTLGELLSACGASPLAGHLSEEVSLPLPLHPQETDEWCWAASAQMSMDLFGTDIRQCRQATDRFTQDHAGDCCNKVDACPSPTKTGMCVQPSTPDFHHYGFTAEKWPGGLPWEDLTKELRTGRPVPFTWVKGDYGHMMVAYGFSTANGMREVLINDPEPPCVGFVTRVTYDYYIADSDHTHGTDYYHVRRMTESPDTSHAGHAVPATLPSDINPVTTFPLLFPTLNNAARCTIARAHKIAATELGFPSVVNPISDVFYATALADTLISRRDLRNYVPGTGNAVRLLKATGLFFVPVGVHGRLTSGVMIRKRGDQFGTVQIGNVPLARELASHLHSAPPWSQAQGLVRVPFLHANFLMARNALKTSLMLLTNDARIGLPLGVWQTPEAVMKELATLNKIVPGNY